MPSFSPPPPVLHGSAFASTRATPADIESRRARDAYYRAGREMRVIALNKVSLPLKRDGDDRAAAAMK